jgi:phage baseplate assembly protein V
MNDSFVFSEVARRLGNVVRFGTVAEIDHKKARIRVKIGKITTTWMPWLTTAGSVKIWNSPVVGEQVCVVAQDGDLAVSLAIPGIFCNKFAAPGNNQNTIRMEFSDDVSIEFNKTNNEFTLEIRGAEVILGGDKFKVSIGASEIEMTPESIRISASSVEIPGFLP